MREEELKKITGGAKFLTSAYLNSISKMISTLYSLGQSIGSSIRYAVSRRRCK